MNEHDHSVFGKNEIGRSRQVPTVKAKTKTGGVQSTTHE